MQVEMLCECCGEPYRAEVVGGHRLLCGDSADSTQVRRLMDGETATLLATDPPYNVSKNYGDNVDDGRSEVEHEAFARTWFEAWCAVTERQIVTPGCNNLARWMRWFDPYHWGTWIKTNAMSPGRVSHFWCWEPVLFFGAKWSRERANDVFNYPVGQQKETGGHPCPKPLGMWADLYQHYSNEGDVVADAFGGSGTAVVAAERTGRRCFTVDIEPRWCDVILRRWEAETGRSAFLVERGESNG